MFGGSDDDVFLYKDVSDSGLGAARDRISGFQQGQDKIDLRGVDGDSSDSDNDQLVFIGGALFTGGGTAGEARFIQAGGNTFVNVNVNTVANTEMQVRLDGLFTLTADDFIH